MLRYTSRELSFQLFEPQVLFSQGDGNEGEELAVSYELGATRLLASSRYEIRGTKYEVDPPTNHFFL